jgi:hypothetical protein
LVLPDDGVMASTAVRVHRLPIPSGGPADQETNFDYADAFEIRLPQPDAHTAEQWVRAGLEQSPRVLRAVILVAHRGILRFSLGPLSSPAHVLGWEIVRSEPEIIHLRASSPIMCGSIVANRVDPTTATLATYLHFNRSRSAQLIWAAVGPVHRRVAPYLMECAAARLSVQ